MDLEQFFIGCLAAAPLRFVLLLDGAPRLEPTPAITLVHAAVVTTVLRGIELSQSFKGGLECLSGVRVGALCGACSFDPPDATLGIADWLEVHGG